MSSSAVQSICVFGGASTFGEEVAGIWSIASRVCAVRERTGVGCERVCAMCELITGGTARQGGRTSRRRGAQAVAAVLARDRDVGSL